MERKGVTLGLTYGRCGRCSFLRIPMDHTKSNLREWEKKK